MNDLFWALYLIDVLSDISALVVIPLAGMLLTFFIVLGSNLDHYGDERKPSRWWMWRVMPWAFVIALVIFLTPSKQTMYLMLGVKTTENVAKSDFGQKIQKIVDAQLDDLMKKYVPKEK